MSNQKSETPAGRRNPNSSFRRRASVGRRRSSARVDERVGSLAPPCNRAHGPRLTAHGPRPTTHLPPAACRLQPPPRSGALLLVCLSLLVLFAVMAITFVMVAGQYRRGSKAEGAHERQADNFRKQLDDAFGQIIRDTANNSSAVRSHSLLADMYGDPDPTSPDGVQIALGQIASATSMPTGQPGQLLDLAVQQSTNLSPFAGYYNGCTLTMLSGSAAMQTARIVGYAPGGDATTGTFRVMAFGNGASPIAGDRLLINGRPFNGTGFGYKPSTGKLDEMASGVPLALLPHRRYVNGPAFAHPHEDYDAADPQNMLLAFVPVTATSFQEIMPSLHRPDLVNYFYQQAKVSDTTITDWASFESKQPDLARQIVLRPLASDHPGFAAINPSFNAITGPWDIDNDGDGITDSIWVDLGYPVQTATDGRQFKPLFAVLCVDLDGRLNMNAHGAWTQLETTFKPGSDGVFGTADDPGAALISGPYAGSLAAGGVYLPRGMGFGPAEINLGALFNSSQLTNLLGGITGSPGVPGRYGDTPGTSVQAGTTGAADPWFRMTWNEYNNDFFDTSLPRSSFSSPPDVWGRGTVGLDLCGQPMYWRPDTTSEIVNNPYLIDLSHASVRSGSVPAADNPFTVAELEALLRRYDLDASLLPNRLEQLVPGIGTQKNLLTTDSADVPVANSALTREMLSSTNAAFVNLRTQGTASVADLLRARIYEERGYTGAITAGSQQAIALNNDVSKMLDVDLIAGLRFNINRPLGNGRDDDSNGVVDEPEEAATELIQPLSSADVAPATANPSTIPNTSSVPIDHDNSGVTGAGNPNQLLARDAVAKQLYVLAMLLRDPAYVYPTTESLPAAASGQPSSQQELTIHRIAQWAINAVDARDADAIMTPFEYDVNPFDGWDCNGIIGDTADDMKAGPDGSLGTGDDVSNGDRRVVWGCEAPALLLTETFAMHDRRVADTNKDLTGKKRDEDSNETTNEDDDLDQVLIPQGSAFFELYCPRNANNPVYPPELYAYDGTNWRLDLGKMAPAGSGVAYPVWRLAITDSTQDNADNDVLTKLAAHPDSYSFDPPQNSGATSNMSLLPGVSASALKIDRIVWFTTVAPTTQTDNDRVYWARSNSALGLLPSQYALIGPRVETRIGGKSNLLGTPSDQSISLNAYGLTLSDGTANSPAAGNDIQAPLTFVVAGGVPVAAGWTDGTNTANHGGPGAEGIGISISEPLYSNASYYSEPKATNPNNGNKKEAYGTDMTNGPFLDEPLDRTQNTLLSGVTTSGVQPNLRRAVFLQRLANPLASYHPVTNPYLTVDWLPIDLTVFNGLDTKPSDCKIVDASWDPQAGNYPVNSLAFATRQRGTPRIGAANALPNIWSPLSESPEATPAQNKTTTGSNEVFGIDLIANSTHTLGYLNSSYQDSTASPRWYTGASSPAPPAAYHGAPLRPFPWLNWQDRPYVSTFELMQVPASTPARLCYEFSTADSTPAYGAGGDRSPFRHLLNFFHDLPAAAGSPHLHRIFDYLRVPSPFVRSETILNATTFAGGTSGDGRDGLHPPFNRVSNYRDVGKLNINTLSTFFNTALSTPAWDSPAYRALLNGYPGPSLAVLCGSIRGSAATPPEQRFNSGNLPTAPPNLSPTEFANPFRGSSGATRQLPYTPSYATLNDVDSTLLRSNGVPPNDTNPLFSTSHNAATDDYRNTDQNCQFRYEDLQRLPNLVTTRSNVYAIWVTMGYFEVEAAGATNAVYPDGYKLKQELGADTGEITRHRAFYIYDRTIPVGYQRGKDLNIEKGILLKRVIE